MAYFHHRGRYPHGCAVAPLFCRRFNDRLGCSTLYLHYRICLRIEPCNCDRSVMAYLSNERETEYECESPTVRKKRKRGDGAGSKCGCGDAGRVDYFDAR